MTYTARYTPRARSFIVFALAIMAALILPACGSLQETIDSAARLREQAALARDEVGARLVSLEQARDALGPGTPQHAATEAAVSLARARLAALDAAVLHADRVLQEMTAPTDSLTRGAGALAPLLPAPAQGPVLLGAALIATLLRANQVRRGAGSIAASINKALDDPEFRQAFERQANTIRSIQTPVARRIVDQETAARPGMKLPI